MPLIRARFAGLLVAVLVGAVGCAEDRRPSGFAFDVGAQDAAEDVGPDAGYVGPTAWLQLFNNSPDGAFRQVDIYARIPGKTFQLANDLAWTNHTGFREVPAETPWDIVFAARSSDEDGTLQESEIITTRSARELEVDTDNLGVFHGFIEASESQLPAFEVTWRQDIRTTPEEDAVNALFFHGAPGLPSVDVSPSNAYSRRIFFDDIAYGTFSEARVAFTQPDVFDLHTGNGTFVANMTPPQDVSPTFGGGVVTAATFGRYRPMSDEEPVFRVSVFTNNASIIGRREFGSNVTRFGQPATPLWAGARIRFVHAASAEGFDDVDLVVGPKPETISNLGYAEATDFLSLPNGTISVDISGTDRSIQRTVSYDTPLSGYPVTKTVFITGNGQNQQLRLRSVDTQETDRFGHRSQDPESVGFHLFHALTTESFSAVDVSFLNTSGDVLRGPVTLDYGNAFSGSVGPATDLATLRVSLDGSNFDFDLSPIDEGTYATIYLADAPTALGISAYALVDAQDSVELPRE